MNKVIKLIFFSLFNLNYNLTVSSKPITFGGHIVLEKIFPFFTALPEFAILKLHSDGRLYRHFNILRSIFNLTNRKKSTRLKSGEIRV